VNVLFISDFSIEQNSGGAQISNDIMIKAGLDRGHQITTYNYNSSPMTFLSNYDVIISSNLQHILSSHQASFVFEKIVSHPKHVRYEHDSCHYLPEEARKSLFSSSIINFFLSDFHISFFKQYYGEYFDNVKIVYDPIDTELFNKKNITQSNDILYCGFLHPLKGVDNLISFANLNPDRQISVYGWAEDENTIDKIKKINNIQFNEKISNEQLIEVYKNHKYIYHNPIVNEPFCRMVAEACLCGLEFIGDESKIGSVQEFKSKDYDSFSNLCKQSPEIFWQTIEENA
jgi:glycosyltransferase involved in cell wall biosynthesis|tara:strand:+ start:559 stop:1419 length:861 start_codon:yes stop_codon:yes gene_type:complete